MYSLHLTCPTSAVEVVSSELWEFGTVGIREIDGLSSTLLIAGFESNDTRRSLIAHFAGYSPRWELEDSTDWVQATKESWPAREVGQRFFVVPPWNEDRTPQGRIRLIQNPGLACGTGDHPCTRLALEALEDCVRSESRIADIGSGSAILTIGGLLLGAHLAVGVDADVAAAPAALQNFALNELPPCIAAGSADCLLSEAFDIVLANISSTVVLALFGELFRIAQPGATLILTGFSTAEAKTFVPMLNGAGLFELGDWACVVGRKRSDGTIRMSEPS
jgi:ribosomal protein L11 methyltransferase